jgi:hypothetical protein
MTRLHFARLTAVLLLVFSSASLLSAQGVETYVFGGGFWSGSSVFDLDMVGGGTYGVKVGGFLDPNWQIDGNLSWYNHFGVSGDPFGLNVIRPIEILEDPKVRSLLWEASGTYQFGETAFGTRFSPYVTFGAGGMTARIKNADSVFVTGGGFIRNPLYLNARSPVPQFIPNPERQIVMDDNDTFFTFSYGGGFKAERLWGAAGFRTDFRGRTIPNFYGESVTRPELTAGLTFVWGE